MQPLISSVPELHALLQELGFGDYEAKAYLALTDAGQCTGYEVAKAAGIPRANVYAVLDRLLARGAVQRLDTAAGTRYAGTPPSKLLAQLERGHQRRLAAARRGFARLKPTEDHAPAISLRGEDELLRRAHAEIDAAHESLTIALGPEEAGHLADALAHAHERGVAIRTLCLQGCAPQCSACRGEVWRLQVQASATARRRWLLLVVDEREALVGQLAAEVSHGLVTAQGPVVELVDAYIRQSLALALLGDGLAGRLDELLSAQARSALDELFPGGDFLAHIQSLGKLASPGCRA